MKKFILFITLLFLPVSVLADDDCIPLTLPILGPGTTAPVAAYYLGNDRYKEYNYYGNVVMPCDSDGLDMRVWRPFRGRDRL